MNYKSSTIYAWGIFVGILLAELAIDYSLRITSNDFYHHSNGVPREIWFFPQIVAAIFGMYFIICGAKYLKNIKYKIIHVVVNLIIGAIVYTLIVFPYVVGSGRG